MTYKERTLTIQKEPFVGYEDVEREIKKVDKPSYMEIATDKCLLLT